MVAVGGRLVGMGVREGVGVGCVGVEVAVRVGGKVSVGGSEVSVDTGAEVQAETANRISEISTAAFMR